MENAILEKNSEMTMILMHENCKQEKKSQLCTNDEEKNVLGQMAELVDIEIGRSHKRAMCMSCGRPQSVCWCSSKNQTALLHVQSLVVVLQHPHEEKRCLRTAPMLQNALPHCKIYKGKKFSKATVPELTSEDAVLLFPGPGAVEVEHLETVWQRKRPYTIVILDGTWHQARAIMNKSTDLHVLKKVVVRSETVSRYVIRTQPSDTALSTVESAALALTALEADSSIYDLLVTPLETLCYNQLVHGAVMHHSKEHRCREEAVKTPSSSIGKRTVKTLVQCGAKHIAGPIAKKTAVKNCQGVGFPGISDRSAANRTDVTQENSDHSSKELVIENCKVNKGKCKSTISDNSDFLMNANSEILFTEYNNCEQLTDVSVCNRFIE